MNSLEQNEQMHSYEAIRAELVAFLPSVGEQVLRLRREAEQDPGFARMKADKSIVTRADELAETLIREWITARFPHDSIHGEEQADKQGGERMWIIDPIDGTYNFTHLGNQFGISVGLAEHNVPQLGVIYYPAEGITLSASKGAGAQINGEALVIQSGREHISEALISASVHPLHLADPRFKKSSAQLTKLLTVMHHTDLGWSYTVDFLHFLQGDADATAHPGATPYDIGAMAAIAQELSLPFSGYDGKPVDFSQEKIPVLISKNKKLHAALIEQLNS